MNKFQIGIAALLIVGVLAAGAIAMGLRGFNNATREAITAGDYNAFINATGKNITQDQFSKIVKHEDARGKIQEAIASNDFTAWKQAMNDKLQLELTQENFDRMVAHYNNRGNQTKNWRSTGGLGEFGTKFGHGPGFGKMYRWS